MSAYMVLQSDLVDKDTLVEALEIMGLEPAVHDEAQTLRGWRNDDRDETAHIVVNRKKLNERFTHASNDLGFRWSEESGQYEVVCSDYDFAQGVLERVNQAYVAVSIQNALRAQRFSTNSNNLQDVQARQRTPVDIVAVKVI